MLHGVGAGWPAGGRGIRELCPGQASLPAATGKIPEVRWFPAPDCSHLQRRRNKVQLQLIHLLTFNNGFVPEYSGGAVSGVAAIKDGSCLKVPYDAKYTLLMFSNSLHL